MHTSSSAAVDSAIRGSPQLPDSYTTGGNPAASHSIPHDVPLLDGRTLEQVRGLRAQNLDLLLMDLDPDAIQPPLFPSCTTAVRHTSCQNPCDRWHRAECSIDNVWLDINHALRHYGPGLVS